MQSGSIGDALSVLLCSAKPKPHTLNLGLHDAHATLPSTRKPRGGRSNLCSRCACDYHDPLNSLFARDCTICATKYQTESSLFANPQPELHARVRCSTSVYVQLAEELVIGIILQLGQRLVTERNAAMAVPSVQEMMQLHDLQEGPEEAGSKGARVNRLASTAGRRRTVCARAGGAARRRRGAPPSSHALPQCSAGPHRAAQRTARSKITRSNCKG